MVIFLISVMTEIVDAGATFKGGVASAELPE
jgi:hypothetical protein